MHLLPRKQISFGYVNGGIQAGELVNGESVRYSSLFFN